MEHTNKKIKNNKLYIILISFTPMFFYFIGTHTTDFVYKMKDAAFLDDLKNPEYVQKRNDFYQNSTFKDVLYEKDGFLFINKDIDIKRDYSHKKIVILDQYIRENVRIKDEYYDIYTSKEIDDSGYKYIEYGSDKMIFSAWKRKTSEEKKLNIKNMKFGSEETINRIKISDNVNRRMIKQNINEKDFKFINALKALHDINKPSPFALFWFGLLFISYSYLFRLFNNLNKNIDIILNLDTKLKIFYNNRKIKENKSDYSDVIDYNHEYTKENAVMEIINE